MNEHQLPAFLLQEYQILKLAIRRRLSDFKIVPEDKYFYELCYCICTPQSKAANALKVQKKLEDADFINNNFNPADILRTPSHYIRFHNQKAKRLMQAKLIFPEIMKILKSDLTAEEKRNRLAADLKGFGMKESSHFLRNIGFESLAILDRHILKHLKICRVINEIPKSLNKKKYLEIEKLYRDFSAKINIPIDELDLLFWSYETKEILK